MKRAEISQILKWGAFVTLITLSMSAAIAVGWPKQSFEYFASQLMGHKVTCGQVSINLNRLLTFDVNDVHIANESWGSVPDMVHIGHLSGSLDLGLLLHGQTEFSELAIKDLNVVLERDEQGNGNWKKPGRLNEPPLSPQQEAKKSRSSLPTILGLVLDHGQILFHTSGGSILDIDLAKVDLNALSADSPVHLLVAGAYNRLPVQLNIETQSFKKLHDVESPFGAKIAGEANSLAMLLDVNLMDPINFDQLQGNLHVNIKNLGAAAAYFGAPFNGPWPVTFDAEMQRQGDKWQFLNSKGSFADSHFSESEISLNEGKRRQPDAVQTTFKIDGINADSFINDNILMNKKDDKFEWLGAEKNPEVLIDSRLNIGNVFYRSFAMSDVKVHGVIDYNESGFQNISFNSLGGKISGSAISTLESDHNHIKAKISLSHLSAEQLMQKMMPGRPLLKGDINLDVSATAVGDMMPVIANSLDGKMTLTMQNGQIARWANHMAAGDIHGFFDKKADMVTVRCANAVVSFQNGLGQLELFAFQTNEGTMMGRGSIDLPRNKLSLLFQTDPQTTSALALDVPISVEGDLANPSVSSAFGHRFLIDAESAKACSI